jgi:hypothetical protein
MDASSLGRICLHPYYAATTSQLVDVYDGTVGKLKPPGGKGDFCPVMGENDCEYVHSGFDINASGMVNDGPYSPLRAPFDCTIVGVGVTSRGNRYVTLQSDQPMQLWDGTSAYCRVKYVHLGICDLRISRGVSGARGLATPPRSLGMSRATTPAAYFLSWSSNSPVPIIYNYMWLNQMDAITAAQRPVSLGNVLPGDRFNDWFGEIKGPDGFPLPTILIDEGITTNETLTIMQEDISNQYAALLSNLLVEESLYLVATRAMSASGILKPVKTSGLRGALASFTSFLLLFEAMAPNSTDQYGPVLWPRSATEGSFMTYGLTMGTSIPRGFCVGFAGNTGTVASKFSGPTAGRHLHLQLFTQNSRGSWNLVHPNTFKWRV